MILLVMSNDITIYNSNSERFEGVRMLQWSLNLGVKSVIQAKPTLTPTMTQ